MSPAVKTNQLIRKLRNKPVGLVRPTIYQLKKRGKEREERERSREKETKEEGEKGSGENRGEEGARGVT